VAMQRGKIFRVRLSSAQHFLLYGGIGEFEQEPLPITVWDSREVSFPLIHALKYLDLEIEPQGAITVSVYADGTLRDTRALTAPLAVRRRWIHELPAGIKGRSFRVGLTASQPFQPWDINLWVKAWGQNQNYTPTSALQRIESQRQERPLFAGLSAGGQG